MMSKTFHYTEFEPKISDQSAKTVAVALEIGGLGPKLRFGWLCFI